MSHRSGDFFSVDIFTGSFKYYLHAQELNPIHIKILIYFDVDDFDRVEIGRQRVGDDTSNFLFVRHSIHF